MGPRPARVVLVPVPAPDDGGLRLYLYKLKSNGSAEIIASSKEGVGSYVMLPVYFKTSDPADGWIIMSGPQFLRGLLGLTPKDPFRWHTDYPSRFEYPLPSPTA